MTLPTHARALNDRSRNKIQSFNFPSTFNVKVTFQEEDWSYDL